MMRHLKTLKSWISTGAVLFLLWAAPTMAGDGPRFFHSGDGRIRLVSAKSGKTFKGIYRDGEGQYKPDALRAIQAAFDAPTSDPMAAISLRLIEFIDFLQDRFKPGAVIQISSGWRSPEYNARLRQAGSLAATASLHQYGMAADIEIPGVSSRKVWEYVRKLGFGGAGYYHGKLVHVDVGPARSWDETSSGVGTGISDDNKLIGLVTDFDRYRPGEQVTLRFIRMTAFPIGVSPEFKLMRQGTTAANALAISFKPSFAVAGKTRCPHFGDIAQMMHIRWRLPRNLAAGRYRIQAAFCDSAWPDMPVRIDTDVFEVIDR
jgi:uncharacterized protein YcbK (DUF882 family)